MDVEQSWRLIEQERLALAALLDDLTSGQWETPSLCRGWRVRDVAAHVSLSGEPLPGWTVVTSSVRARGSLHRLNEIMTGTRAQRPPDQIVASLREHAGSRKVPFGSNYHNLLFDLLVHSQDIAIPLGLSLAMPAEGARDSAATVWALGWPFQARRRLSGLCLTATDTDWAGGDGPEVRGSISDLLLLLTGRTAGLGRLSGPGVPGLASRFEP